MAIATRPTNYSGTGNTYVDGYPASYSDAARPAPAGAAHEVIYNSTQRRHQVSSGTAWLDLGSNAAIEALQVVTQATRPAPAAMIAGYVFVSDLGPGTFQRSNGVTWVTLGTDYVSAISAILGVCVAGPALPADTIGYAAPAAGRIYVDPSAGRNGAGSLADPRNTLAGIVCRAGTEVLLKRGTTLVGAISISGVTGTAGSPVVIAVYEPTTGARVAASVRGGATINANGASIGIDLQGCSFVCIESIRVTGAIGSAGINIQRGSNNQVLRCITDSLPSRGVFAFESNALTIDGCQASNNGRDGLCVESDRATVTGTRLYRNVTESNGEHGIRYGVYTAAGVFADGESGGNTSRLHVAGTDGDRAYGLRANNLRNVLIYRNNFSDKRYIGLGLQGFAPYASDVWSDVRIVSNEVNRNCMGIHLFAVRAAKMGGVIIEHNRCHEQGSRDGGRTSADPTTNYGRGIELFGFNEASRCERIVMRFNSCAYSYCWDQWMTEGVGIGFDDATAWCVAYMNLCAENEGHGSQTNTNLAIRRFGNILVNNNRLALNARNIDRGAGTLGLLRVQLYRAGNDRGTLDFLNILAGGLGDYQRIGVGDAGGSTVRGFIHNNVIVSARDAGVARAGATTASHNRFVNCPQPVIDVNFNPVAAEASDVVSNPGGTPTALDAFRLAGKSILNCVPHYTTL